MSILKVFSCSLQPHGIFLATVISHKISLVFATRSLLPEIAELFANDSPDRKFILELIFVSHGASIVGNFAIAIGIQHDLDTNVPVSSTLDGRQATTAAKTKHIKTPADPSWKRGDDIEIVDNPRTSDMAHFFQCLKQ